MRYLAVIKYVNGGDDTLAYHRSLIVDVRVLETNDDDYEFEAMIDSLKQIEPIADTNYIGLDLTEDDYYKAKEYISTKDISKLADIIDNSIIYIPCMIVITVEDDVNSDVVLERGFRICVSKYEYIKNVNTEIIANEWLAFAAKSIQRVGAIVYDEIINPISLKIKEYGLKTILNVRWDLKHYLEHTKLIDKGDL